VTIQLQGIIRGKQIELERETPLPTGAVVMVEIQPVALTLEEKRKLIQALCGAWADDPSLPAIFAEIESERSIVEPREVDFGASS
jgi:hypothetical protein